MSQLAPEISWQDKTIRFTINSLDAKSYFIASFISANRAPGGLDILKKRIRNSHFQFFAEQYTVDTIDNIDSGYILTYHG